MIGSLILEAAGTAGLLTAEAKSATDSDAISASNKSKLWKSVIQGPVGVIGVLRKMAGKATGVVGLNLSVASLLRQSQIFTGMFGSFMQIIGAFVDITLAPMMPIIFKFFKWLALHGPTFAKFIETLFRWAWITIEWIIQNFVNPVLKALGIEDVLSWPKWGMKTGVGQEGSAFLAGFKNTLEGKDSRVDLPPGDDDVDDDDPTDPGDGDGDGDGDGKKKWGKKWGVDPATLAGQIGAFGTTPSKSLVDILKETYNASATGEGGGLYGALISTGRLSLSGLAAPPDVAFASATWRQSEQEKFEDEHSAGTNYFQAIHKTEERSFQSGYQGFGF
jgi:hypothetical protein